jgi:hypothetical protein
MGKSSLSRAPYVLPTTSLRFSLDLFIDRSVPHCRDGQCDLPIHSSFLNKTNMRDGISYILYVTYNPNNARSIDLYVPVTKLNL